MLIWVSPCRAHGVDGAIERAEGFCVTSRYDDGEPMSYAAVEIKAPDSKIGFQNGRTDRNGRFMFKPDAPGRWQTIVQDGMGHRLAFDVEVGEDPGAMERVHAGKTATGPVPGHFRNILTGLAIIFGLCGMLYGRGARRQFRSVHTRG